MHVLGCIIQCSTANMWSSKAVVTDSSHVEKMLVKFQESDFLLVYLFLQKFIF